MKYLNDNLGKDAIKHKKNQKMLDDVFLKQGSETSRNIRQNLKVSPRTFLLPEDQEKLEKDEVTFKLSHKCENC